MNVELLQPSFLILLFIIAFLYASVGHGGASGYLALMAFFSFAPELMKSSALTLNIFVSFIAFVQFYKAGYFKWKLFYPFAIGSIPAAFIGAQIVIEPMLYKQILGVLLIFPSLRLFGLFGSEKENMIPNSVILSLFLGAIIGVFSGMIGIGGGILLSPVILLLGWANIKETASISALFIFVNSTAAMIGLISQNTQFESNIGVWIIVAFTAGLLGARYTSQRANDLFLKKLLAFTLILASAKLLLF